MDQDLKLLIAKAEDAVRLSDIRNTPKFLGFLSPLEEAAVLSAVKNRGVTLFGGYENAERKMLGVLPDYLNGDLRSFPISVLRIYYKGNAELSHRDVLGAFMSTGVKRSVIGDIVFGENYAVAFVADEIADYLINQVDKIKNVGVELKLITDFDGLEIDLVPKTIPLSFTVSSPRLDAVLSGLARISRAKSEELILDGVVYVNSLVVNKPTYRISKGDKITLRGVGKFVIKNMGQFSKKGREIIDAEKYI